jgi:hypothetical protein
MLKQVQHDGAAGGWLRTFLLLWLPGAVLVVAGLPALLFAGQLNVADWCWPALGIFLVAGWLAGGRDRAALVGGGALAAPLLCWLAAGRLPDLLATLLLAGCVGLALAAGLQQRGRKWGRAALCLAAALSLPILSQPAVLAPSPGPRPKLGVLSALPLFWQEGAVGPQARADAPIIGLLKLRYDLLAEDGVRDPILSQVDRLLIAQPRAFAPEELVAIDAWVRRGGRALVLADPLLRWPSSLPMGDRRRAPAVSLLGPLIAHWGLEYAPDFPSESRESRGLDEQRLFMDDGRLMTVFAASPFRPTGRDCAVFAGGMAARCTVGRGSAVLIADADLIDDRLWLADPARPADPRAWSADTPALVAGWLGEDLGAGVRRWVVDAAHLHRGLRWALLYGLAWAGVGTWLLRRRTGPVRVGFRPRSGDPPPS